jgi:NADH dehydrogenase FAD-containing subunit
MTKGYFTVNKYMQSTSHPNVFVGGDFAIMDQHEHSDVSFPPKVGIYAVSEGSVIANNIAHYLNGEELEEYVPHTEFLTTLMTGDRKAVGTQFGFTFDGKWVWNLKEYIDTEFMNLYTLHYSIKDGESSDENKEEAIAKEKADTLTPEQAAALLKEDERQEDFLVQFMVLKRMKNDTDFKEGVQKEMAE